MPDTQDKKEAWHPLQAEEEIQGYDKLQALLACGGESDKPGVQSTSSEPDLDE